MHAPLAVLLLAIAAADALAAAPVDCRVAMDDIAFGEVDALRGRDRTAMAVLTVACTGEGVVTVSVALSPEGDPRHRALGDASGAPAFALYLDPAMRLPWGDGSAGSVRLQRRIAGDSQPVRIPVHARLRADATHGAGYHARRLVIQSDILPEETP